MIYRISLVIALIFGFSVFAGPQQEKMKACNEQASGKKGDERKAFMKTCLAVPAAPGKSTLPSLPPPAGGKLSPQERMKKCNEEAKGKSGPERKVFMSQCLKSN